MSIDPNTLLFIVLITFFGAVLCSAFGHPILCAVLTIINVICLILLLLIAADKYETEQQPLRESEAAYKTYIVDILESYGYSDITVEYDLSSRPGLYDDEYSPDIHAVGTGDPDFTAICRMLKKLGSYTDKENDYLFEADRVNLRFHGESGTYSYDAYDGAFYQDLRTKFKFDKDSGTWIPAIPVRGMGESQISHTLLGNPTSVTETEEGTSYLWVTGKRDNYEAIVTDGHVSCMRVMDTYRGSRVYAEDREDS